MASIHSLYAYSYTPLPNIEDKAGKESLTAFQSRLWRGTTRGVFSCRKLVPSVASVLHCFDANHIN
jgi:hypothetical protein